MIKANIFIPGHELVDISSLKANNFGVVIPYANQKMLERLTDNNLIDTLSAHEYLTKVRVRRGH